MTTHLEKAWMTESEKLFCGSNCLRKGDLRTNGKAPSHIVDDQGHFGTLLQASGLNYFQSQSLQKALDFDIRVILAFRSPFSTLRFSLKIKFFGKQNLFYISDILHDFSISSF